MKGKLPNGAALKVAANRAKANQERQRETARLQKEWVGDSELTREQLQAKLTSLREDFYARHPEFKVNAA